MGQTWQKFISCFYVAQSIRSRLAGSCLLSGDSEIQALFILWFSHLPHLAPKAALAVGITLAEEAGTRGIMCGKSEGQAWEWYVSMKHERLEKVV